MGHYVTVSLLLLGTLIWRGASRRFRGLSEPSPSATEMRIPLQLILTGKPDQITELPPPVRKNVERTRDLNPDLAMRYLGDSACREFLQKHNYHDLLTAFEAERRGSYRGDICRAVVLYEEGGFYIDNDVQMKVPFKDIVDGSTTFLTAYTAGGKEIDGLLNAVMAAQPRSEVLLKTLGGIQAWYGGNGGPGQVALASSLLDETQSVMAASAGDWMGPSTLRFGVESFLATECPGVKLRWAAEQGGSDQLMGTPPQDCRDERFAMLQEAQLDCVGHGEECAEGRKDAAFDGVRYGIFASGSERRLVAWSRFAECKNFGCDGGGWDTQL